jgi:hypothetical protein
MQMMYLHLYLMHETSPVAPSSACLHESFSKLPRANLINIRYIPFSIILAPAQYSVSILLTCKTASLVLAYAFSIFSEDFQFKKHSKQYFCPLIFTVRNQLHCIKITVICRKTFSLNTDQCLGRRWSVRVS